MAKTQDPKRTLIQLSEGELHYAMSRAVVQGDFCFVSGTVGYDYNKKELPEERSPTSAQHLRQYYGGVKVSRV